MERSKRKAINFDLDTVIMKELGVYPSRCKFNGKNFRRVIDKERSFI